MNWVPTRYWGTYCTPLYGTSVMTPCQESSLWLHFSWNHDSWEIFQYSRQNNAQNHILEFPLVSYRRMKYFNRFGFFWSFSLFSHKLSGISHIEKPIVQPRPTGVILIKKPSNPLSITAEMYVPVSVNVNARVTTPIRVATHRPTGTWLRTYWSHPRLVSKQSFKSISCSTFFLQQPTIDWIKHLRDIQQANHKTNFWETQETIFALDHKGTWPYRQTKHTI